jgi:acetolactate synthase I/II/III large subunit
MKVYQAISDALHAEGVTTAFAVMGDANQNLFVDIAERHRVEVVSCRHEQNVVAIADGYTRFGSDLGVALVTSGPGLTNAATSMVAARYRRSPVLVLAGAPSLGDLHSPQLIDQVACGKLLAGAVATLETPESLAAQLDRVFGHIRGLRGPVVFNMPANVQNMEAPPGWSYRPSYGGYLPTVPSEEHLLRAARRLAESKSPAILAGQGAVRSGAAKIIAELSAYLRAPIATTLPAKGFCADEPLWMGVSGGLGEGVVAPVLEGTCDLLVVVGASMNQWTTHHGDLVKARQVIQIDRDEQAFGAFQRADVALQGDARATVEALFEHVRRLVPSPRSADQVLERKIAAGWKAHRAPIEYETAPDGSIDPRLAIRELDRLLPEKRLVVAAGGHAGYLVCQLVRIGSPTDWNYTIDFGALGQGLGTAIGAAFARRGERVYHLTADGEFMMNLADFHTAVNNALPMTIIVLNDQAFGQERHDLEHKKLPAKYAMQPSPDFARLAEGFGAQGFRFDTPESLVGLPAALERAESFRGPTVLDVRINGAYEAPVSQEIAKALT